jgi:general secretion pathway protein D
MTAKNHFYWFVVLAFTPVMHGQTSKTVVPNRPNTKPRSVHVSTNSVTANSVSHSTNVPANPLGKPFNLSGTNKPTTPTFVTPPGIPTGTPAAPAANVPAANVPAMVPGANGVPPGMVMQPGAIQNPDDAAIYEYNFISTPIDQILDEYAELVNRMILRSNNGQDMVAPGTLITLRTRPNHKLNRREAIMALETVMNMNGVTVVPIGEKFLKVAPSTVAGSQGGAFNTTDAAHIPDAGRFITQIVQLKYAGTDITAALTPFSRAPNSIIFIPSTQTLVLRDFAENVKRMMEMVEKIDVSSPMVIKPKVIAIKYALASDIANALGSLSGGGGGTVSVGSHQAGGGLGGGRGIGGGIGGGGMSGSGSYGPGGTVPGQPGYGGTTGVQGTSSLASPGTTTRSSFQNNLARIIKNAASATGGGDFQIIGQTKIVADERTNSLLIFANDEDMTMIELIIQKLDVVLAQVLIEAIIVDVALTKDRNLSVSYLQSGSVKNGKLFGGVNNLSSSAKSFLAGSTDTNGVVTTSPAALGNRTALPGGLSFIGQFSDFDVALEAIESDSRATILSRPRVQTSHAVPALLFNGQTIPYITGTSYGGYNGGLGSSQYQQKEVGISLEVLPLINPDGLVVMDIRQNIEEVSGTTKIDQNDVPITSKRQAEAKVAVKDRETIILGGFIRSTKSKSNSGVPFLKDIPGLGVLFRSTKNTSDQDELIVLIRPTVLPTPEIASKFAAEERNRLTGVKQGERDLRIEEEERYRRIEEDLRKDEDIRKAREAREAKKRHPKAEAYQYQNGSSYLTNQPVTTPDL